MNKIILTFLLGLSSLISVLSEEHDFQLGVPFTDNMILQRDVKVPVWGQDIAGSEITVKFSGQTKKTITDEHGDWMVKLDPLKASSSERTIEISNNKGNSITLKGVLVGEVWFSSGQSNMVWIAGKSMCNELAKEIASSKEELPIREININTVSALYPQKQGTSDGGWKKSSSASGFSALSLSFAYDLYKELKIPIGILLSAHSNTRIEAFTQRRAIIEHPKLKGDADLILNADPLLNQGQKAFDDYYDELRSWQREASKSSELGGKVPARPNLPGISGMWRGPSQFFNGKIAPVVPYAIRGQFGAKEPAIVVMEEFMRPEWRL